MTDTTSEKVLQNFAARLKDQATVPKRLVETLSTLFGEGRKVSADEVEQVISTHSTDTPEDGS